MVEPQEGMKVQEIVEWAEYAEREGYGYFFRSDHILPILASDSATDSPECWTTLSIIAAKTQKIRFGQLVSPIGFRNPALLARMACTLDSYSGGRMCLGLGAGWYEPEYRAHGYEFPPFRVRRKEVEEGYKIVRGMTEGKRLDFDGGYYSAHVDCYPRPAKGKVHLIGGGRNPRIVGTLAKYVDEWNVFNCPLDTFHKLKELLLKSRESTQPLEISQMCSFLIAKNKTELDAKLKKEARFRSFGSTPDEILKKVIDGGRFAGSPDIVRTQLDEKIKAGVERIYFQILDPKDKDMVDDLTDLLKEI